MKADEARWTGKLDWRDFKKGRTEAHNDGKPARRRGATLGRFVVRLCRPPFILEHSHRVVETRHFGRRMIASRDLALMQQLDELQAQGEDHAAQILSTFPRGEDVGVPAELHELAAPWTALELSITRLTAQYDGTGTGTARADALLEAMQRDFRTIDEHVRAVMKVYEIVRRSPDPTLSVEAMYESYKDAHIGLTRCVSPEAMVLDGDGDFGSDCALMRPIRPASRAANTTPSRTARKPDMYRTKEDKKRDSGRRRTAEDRVVRLWHGLQVEQVPAVAMGQGQERLRELMVARAAAVVQWAKHLNFL